MKKSNYRLGGDTPYVDTRFTIEGGHLYVQKIPKSVWIKKSTPLTLPELEGAKLATTTAIKIDVAEIVHYFGDFHLDIDLKGDITTGAQVALKLMYYLRSLGVCEEDIHLWASGSKGFHLRIPARCFMGVLQEFSGTFAIACRAFARHLIEYLAQTGLLISGIDLAIYKAGKGQLLRLPGERENGLSKVALDWSEAETLAIIEDREHSMKLYQELCSAPRENEAWRPDPMVAEQLASLFRRVATKAVEDDQKSKVLLKALEESEGLGNPIVGRRILRNMLAALLECRGPNGEMPYSKSHADWTTVAMMFHWVGVNYDVLSEAEQAFITYSKATEGFVSEADCLMRFHEIYEDKAKSLVTPASLFAKVKKWGFVDPDPTAKGSYGFEEPAPEVLNHWLAIKDPSEQRKRAREAIFVSAFRACQIGGYKATLCSEVLERAGEISAIRELKKAVSELDDELGTATEANESDKDKANKWTNSKMVFGLDQFNGPVGVIKLRCVDLNDTGSVLAVMAEDWVSEQATADKPFPQKSMAELIPTLIAKARRSGLQVRFQERWLRVGGVTYLDMHWGVVRVSKSGWEVVECLPPHCYFKRSMWCKPMPQLPRRSGQGLSGIKLLNELERFTKIVNLPASAVPVLAAYLVFPIRHETGSPLLVWGGPPGSGKSTAAITARGFMAPSSKVADSMPNSQTDLVTILGQNLVTLLDNVSQISQAASNLICRFLTGLTDEMEATRKFFTNSELVCVRAGRFLMTTGINEFVRIPDLVSRSQFLKLLPMDGPVETVSELQVKFDEQAPQIMAALLDLCVCAWIAVEQFQKDHPIRRRISRMASWDLHLAACFEALGLGWEGAVKVLEAQRGEQAVESVQNHKILGGLCKLKGEFLGTVGQLSTELLEIAGYRFGIKPPTWPTNRTLLDELVMHQQALIKAGFEIQELPPVSSKQAKRWRIVAPAHIFD